MVARSNNAAALAVIKQPCESNCFGLAISCSQAGLGYCRDPALFDKNIEDRWTRVEDPAAGDKKCCDEAVD